MRVFVIYEVVYKFMLKAKVSIVSFSLTYEVEVFVGATMLFQCEVFIALERKKLFFKWNKNQID